MRRLLIGWRLCNSANSLMNTPGTDLRDHRGMPDDGDEIAPASCFDSEHAEAIVGVVERDAVDQSSRRVRLTARVKPGGSDRRNWLRSHYPATQEP